MQTYIGVKLVEAEAMTLGDYNIARGWTLPADENAAEEGYRIVYPDGYVSWSPKGQFEQAYLGLEMPNIITTAVLESMVAGIESSQIDPKTSLVKAVTVTGFVEYATSSCVDPANYSDVLGLKIGQKRIEEKLWFAMGFVLQWAKYGLKHTPKV